MSATTVSASPPAPRIFRGWWMVVVAIIGQTFGLSTSLVYTFGVFAKPLANEFHASRASIALAVSMLDLAVTFSAPGVGRFVDRFGARKVILASLLALVSCLIALANVHSTLWHVYFLYAVAGCTGIATVGITYGRVVANWFDRRRGFALGLASTGIGLGAFLGPPLAQFLINKGGWRFAYLGFATCTVVVALPVVAIFLRSTPEECGLRPDNAPASTTPAATTGRAPGMSLSQAVRTRAFWIMCGIFFIVAACGTGTAAHVTPLLSDNGSSLAFAAFASSIFGFASIAGRVGNGYLVDRFFAPRVAAVIFAAGAAGIAMLSFGATGYAAYAAIFLVGLAIGAEADVMPYLISRYFGMHSMAELYGCVFGCYTLGNATGRTLIGHGFDVTGSYRLPLSIATVALLLATLGTFALGRYGEFPGVNLCASPDTPGARQPS